MSWRARELTQQCWTALGGHERALEQVSFVGEGDLPSAFAVTDLASAAIATAALAVSEGSRVTVDRRLASMWFHTSLRPIGWKLPAPWDPIAGDYPCADGWIRLHTNAPHHRRAAEQVLGVQGDREAVARAVAGWEKTKLETAVVAAGGCAAEMRSAAEWARHPQGRAVAGEPLAHLEGRGAAKPLRGARVLDLTRVLAGPVATRFLAGFGADVLRIDPPGWDEPGVVPEVTSGKRCARLDLREARDRATFEGLLSKADVLIHGYRPEALERLGFGVEARRKLAPGLVDVSLDAYGWTGPWAGRRGFDSLLQMSSGIAEAGMRWRKADKPVPLPVQALDHATGYLMAAAAIRGLNGGFARARLSLARTARLLTEQADASPLAPETEADLAPSVEKTSWGDARRLLPPVTVEGAPMQWSRGASALGSAEARWS